MANNNTRKKLNSVKLMGGLTQDPDLDYTPNQTAVLTLRIAHSRSYKNNEGTWEETTMYIDVDVWGKQAENCAKYLEKGSQVLVDGEIRQDQWQNDAGENRSKIKLNADWVYFLSQPGNSKNPKQGNQQNQSSNQNNTDDDVDEMLDSLDDDIDDEQDLPEGGADDDVPF